MNKSIQKMFEPLAGRYELVNHVITFGLDTVWRKKAAGIAAGAAEAAEGAKPRTSAGPSASSAASRAWLDVSTGTGEMAELLSRRADPGTTVLAADFSLPMLREAARKFDASVKAAHGKAAHEKAASGTAAQGRVTGSAGILLLAADDRQLPLRDASLDLVTISLGTRNLNTSRSALVSCFSEFHRVLKPGGKFVNLETSQPRSRAVRALFHGYVRGFLRPVASTLSGNSSAYSYLASSMRSFYEADELTAIMREAGFARVEVTPLFLGIAAIHVAEK